MVALTRVTLTCDMCGNAQEVQTRTLGLDGKTYEVDLCPKDSAGLDKAAAGYVSKARTGPATRGPRPIKQKKPHPRPGRAEQRKAGSTPKRAANGTGPQPEKGVFVYGIFPADIEVTAGMPGVGENPGPMRAVRAADLAALVSEVHLSPSLGSPDDVRIHRKTLDASARHVPVLALPFGTVLSSDKAVAKELLEAHRDEFTQALQELEGRAQFVVQGRYLETAGAASRKEDTRALEKAMEGQYVASKVRKAAREPDAFNVAFLVDIEQKGDVERVIENLAREWDGRIQLRLRGPMAAYDFVPTMEMEAVHP